MEIHLSQILFQVINFGIIFFLLKKFVYKPVLRILDERAEKIKDGMSAAEKNITLQEKIEAEKKEVLRKARLEAKKVVASATKEADELIKKARQTAKDEARQVSVKERQAFEADLKKTRSQFESELVTMVGEATKAVLKELLDVKASEKLIETQIKQLTSTKVKLS